MVSTHLDAMRQALELAAKINPFGSVENAKARDAAIKALAEQPAQPQQEPVATVKAKFEGGTFVHWTKLPVAGMTLYASPPAPEWIPVTQALLDAQHPWLYQPMWIVMKHCSHLSLIQGHYEWRQGRYPDRFLTDIGNVWAFDCTHVMPIVRPALPGAKTD